MSSRSRHHDAFTHRLRGLLFISPISDTHVRDIPPESLNNPLEAAFLPDFRRAVDILNTEHLAQPVQEELCQGWDKLGRGHKDVHAIWSVNWSED